VDKYQLTDSSEYAERRNELRLAEIELMRHREKVAALRRQLPLEVAQDYVFYEGPKHLDAGDDPIASVRLSELFTAPERPLVIYHLMYGKGQSTPCPMCSMWIDGFNGVARHIAQNVDLVVAAAADVAPLRSYGRDRGWDQLRLLSCGDNTFKVDLGSENASGDQHSTVSVFVRGDDGSPLHSYTAHPSMAADIDQRGIDLLSPVWHLLDLTPQGRGDWFAELEYADSAVSTRQKA
jgi:predicted dithiol-disulfide oxidoreductase (DUF899 family)